MLICNCSFYKLVNLHLKAFLGNDACLYGVIVNKKGNTYK